MQYKHLGSILLIAAVTLCACQHRHQPSEYIQTADSLLWSNPDSCLRYIEERTSELSEYEQNCEELIWQHALYKTTDDPVNDSILEALNDYFDSVQDWERAGETEHIRGNFYMHTGDYFYATYHLKRAENYFNISHPKAILLGTLYLYLGISAQEERRNDIATEYYQMAIPYLKQANKPLYLATTYNAIVRTWENTDTAKIISFFDSAHLYAEQIDNAPLCKEIQARKGIYLDYEDERSQEELLSNLHYLCDSMCLYQYAEMIAKIYLKRNEFEKVSQYTNILGEDSIYHNRSLEQYYDLSSQLLYQQGNIEQAYKIVKQFNTILTRKRGDSDYMSCYIISRKYEAAKEQLWRQEEQEKKERAYMWLAICALLCLLAGSSAGYLLLRHKKTQLQLQLNEERNKRLSQEVETQREVMQAKIKERVDVMKQLHQWGIRNGIQLPKSIDLLSPQRAAGDQDNWKRFYEEYNLCYADKLKKMKEQNPELTESDLQCLALEDLGFDTSEIAFILGLSRRTVWNRRNLAKQHLGEEID